MLSQLYQPGGMYISTELTNLHGQTDHPSRRYRPLFTKERSSFSILMILACYQASRYACPAALDHKLISMPAWPFAVNDLLNLDMIIVEFHWIPTTIHKGLV